MEESRRCAATYGEDPPIRCVYKEGHEGSHYNDAVGEPVEWGVGVDESSTELTNWVDQAMFEAVPMASKRPSVRLLWATPDPLGAIAAGARMYEGKPTYSLDDIGDKERVHYFGEMMKTHLQAPFEFVKMHFFIESVDRSFTHQHVRQRTAVYAQESLRFAVKEGFADEVIKPPAYIYGDDSGREKFDELMKKIEETYMSLIAAGWPAEDARAVLPHCVATRINYVTDLKNLTAHAGNRLCTQAQFIWREVFIGMVKAISEHHGFVPDPASIRTERTRWEHITGPQAGPLELPEVELSIPVERMRDDAQGTYTNWQFRMIAESGLFRPICYQLGHCPYTAVFDRQCTIRERVQAGRFDEIDPREFMADPTAGRRDDPVPS